MQLWQHCWLKYQRLVLVLGWTIFSTAGLSAAGLSVAGSVQETDAPPSAPQVHEIDEIELGSTRNVHQCGNLLTAGQFTAADISLFTDKGIERIITLREDGEVDWDEPAAVEEAGIEFIQIPFRSPESLTDEIFDEVRKHLRDRESKTLLHCGSANRVGGVWLPFRVLDEGVELETALAEAKRIGLRNEQYEARALDYIERKQKEEADRASRSTKDKLSVKPGINANFVDPDMDIETFIKRFEVESREVFVARQQILKSCEIQPNDRVADIGAGTGLFTRMFSVTVGEHGWVFAIDIAPRFIEHINLEAAKHGLENITAVLCQEDSINLPPQSVDVAFICDTYHHFEYPQDSLASIHRALTDGGTLIVVDFERIPGKSRPWLLDHVRAGKEVFRSEIEQAGFKFVDELEVAGLEENYFLKFRKN